MRSKEIEVVSLRDCKVADFPSAASVIFSTPEAAISTRWKTTLKEKSNISLIAYDEAHCISTWGMDFRPEYRHISALQSIFDVPNLALTATATQQIKEDIFTVLSFDDKTNIMANLSDRPNVFLHVQPATENFEKELDWILEYFKGEKSKNRKIILL